MLNFLGKFAYEWYIEDSRAFWNGFVGFLKFTDRDFGLIANIYNWLSPLYGDYSLIGKFIGPILRTLRILFFSLVYAVFFIVAVILYFLWLAAPAAIAVMILNNIFYFLNK